MTQHNDWVEEYPAAITICDTQGIITGMNAASRKLFAKRGGAKLIGTSLFDCHSPKSNEIIREMLKTGETNTYITDKKGMKKLIHQSPWYNNGTVAGLIETIIELKDDLEVKKR